MARTWPGPTFGCGSKPWYPYSPEIPFQNEPNRRGGYPRTGIWILTHTHLCSIHILQGGFRVNKKPPVAFKGARCKHGGTHWVCVWSRPPRLRHRTGMNWGCLLLAYLMKGAASHPIHGGHLSITGENQESSRSSSTEVRLNKCTRCFFLSTGTLPQKG